MNEKVPKKGGLLIYSLVPLGSVLVPRSNQNAIEYSLKNRSRKSMDNYVNMSASVTPAKDNLKKQGTQM